MAEPTGARALALDVIRRVTDDGAYSNLALAAALDRSTLDRRDRRFATELVYGTLRRVPAIDREVSAAAGRPVEAIDPVARAALRLGVHQLRSTRVPAHAAVSATVALVPARARGFVNAVLRRLAGTAPLPEEPGAGLTDWAVEELRRLLPSDEVDAAALALAEPAPLSLRTNRCRTTPEQVAAALADAGIEARPGRHDPDVLTVGSASPATLPGFRDGWFAIQDEASALVVRSLGARPGERVLDACAGPGGKATTLACSVAPDGAVVASDVSPRRAALVRAAAARLGVGLAVLVADGRRPAVRGPFDAVLVDAPCSGLGSARRRPELLWRPRREDLSRLARLQVALLDGVAGLVRPGGRLVYSVCTFPRAETDAVLRAFRTRRPGFEPLGLPGPDGVEPVHRLWPHRHGTDAMFLAGFRRASTDPG